MRHSWTQPSCTPCWHLHNGERKPFRLKLRERETCVYCGKGTTSGIYVRVDPTDPHLHPTLPKYARESRGDDVDA